ncbi:hypothetical protein FOA52_009469 [Chlamydomonas sp. UWO 241]|nr:hypothetical protein FOA52_009469 [Chlamydomonas sp. UWO 241]
MEKFGILKLAQRKAGAWECRCLLACEASSTHFHFAFYSACTFAEVQQLYRDISLRVHPDKNPGFASATAAFQFLQQAFEAMKNRRRSGMIQ